ncbi:endonuclease/exonuclease/phosphatase, partial [Streptomyces olivaceus]
MASRSATRLAALTVAAVCSAASTLVLTAPAHAGPDPAGPVRIHDIQGSTRLSPYAGKQVTDVAGIVIGVRGNGGSKGFWIQDPRPDA